MESILLRAEEVAELLGLGRTKVFEMIAVGDLPTVRIGRCVRVPRADLDRWVRGQVTRMPDRETAADREAEIERT